MKDHQICQTEIFYSQKSANSLKIHNGSFVIHCDTYSDTVQMLQFLRRGYTMKFFFQKVLQNVNFVVYHTLKCQLDWFSRARNFQLSKVKNFFC